MTDRAPLDTELRDRFIRLFPLYFPGAGLPVTFERGGDANGAQKAPVLHSWKCLICDLTNVRNGTSLLIREGSLSCSGAKYFCGYATERAPDFRYFLSSGKPGGVPGERYKKSPELVDAADTRSAPFPAAGRPFLFRRWDRLTASDNPHVVIFFARGEVLSGLFTLANFEEADSDGVVCPFTSGCGSLILYPWLEQQKEHPRAVLGMFDPSARPCVPVDMLTFAVPMKKFVRMVADMEESFLITDTWKKVMRKIDRSRTAFTR